MGTQQYIKDVLVVKAAEQTVGRRLTNEELSPEIGVELPTGRVVFVPQLAFPMELIPTHAADINEDHLDWFNTDVRATTAKEEKEFSENLFQGRISAIPKEGYSKVELPDANDRHDGAYLEPEVCLDGKAVDPDHVEDEDEKYDRLTRGNYGQEDL
jgi:hypothetical protein